MDGLIAFELAPGYEEFSGGNVSLVGGELFDVGEALDKGDGRIVLGPNARANDDGDVSEAEAERAARDGQIADALASYPGLHRIEPDEDDEPPSFDAVDLSLASGPTKAELRERANELDIQGRSSMDKDELAEAIANEEARLAAGGDSGESTEGGDGEGGAGDGEGSTEGSDD